MKTKKMLLPALFSMVLTFSLILPASVVAQGQLQYKLTINSTEGGSVTTPGEGTFTYDVGRVVSLVAEPQEDHRFVRWTGDVWMMEDVNAASATVTMLGNYAITANFAVAQAINIGIKAAEWIKFEYSVTGLPAGQSYPEWLKLDVLSVEGTRAVIRVTMLMTDGTEQSNNATVYLAAGSGEDSGLSGFVIPATQTTGDSVYITGYGNMSIEGETTRNCVGASRTVLYASLSQNQTRLTYYWDKLTGIMVEASVTSGNATMTAKAIETEMWEATSTRLPWWVRVIVAVAVAAGGFCRIALKEEQDLRGMLEAMGII